MRRHRHLLHSGKNASVLGGVHTTSSQIEQERTPGSDHEAELPTDRQAVADIGIATCDHRFRCARHCNMQVEVGAEVFLIDQPAGESRPISGNSQTFRSDADL